MIIGHSAIMTRYIELPKITRRSTLMGCSAQGGAVGLREELVSAVQTRLQRVAAGDQSAVLDADALTDAQRLASILNEGDTDTRHMLGRLYLHRFQALTYGEGRPELDAAADMFAPCFIAGVDGLPETLLPILARRAIPIAFDRLRQAAVTVQAIVNALRTAT